MGQCMLLYGSSCSPVMGSMLLCSGRSPEKHASLPLFHQHRAAEAPQKSMLLCPSSISTAQRRLPIQKSMLLCPSSISPAQRKLPRKACFSAPLPSASRSGGSPEKHASLLLFHQHRAAEAPQKSMLLCPSFISPAQRKLPRKACFSAPLPSASRSGSSPEKHASLLLFHQHRAAEAPQKSMLLCSSSISTAQRRLPRKACFSVPLPSAPRSGSSPEKHTSLLLFHQHRAAEAPQKSMLLCSSSSISTAHSAQRKLPRKAYISAPLPSAPRSGSSPEKHASLLLIFHQHRALRAAEAPQKSSIHLCPSSISTTQRKLPRKAPFHPPRTHAAAWELPLPEFQGKSSSLPP